MIYCKEVQARSEANSLKPNEFIIVTNPREQPFCQPKRGGLEKEAQELVHAFVIYSLHFKAIGGDGILQQLS